MNSTSSLSNDFLLLENDPRFVSEEKVLTRSVRSSTRDGMDILLGLDSLGLRHLLIPSTDDVPTDVSSRGVTLTKRMLGEADGQAYADLTCTSSVLNLVFERFCEDVLDRIVARTDLPAPAVSLIVLEEWRDLLRTAQSDFGRESAVGLTGELEVLRLLARGGAPSLALEAWSGPAGAVHDFVAADGDLEVKATTAVDPNVITVSNLDQLDPTLTRHLHLVVVHLHEDPAGPTLDDRIEDILRCGVPRSGLLDKVADYGYIYESGQATALRFATREVFIWAVEHDFPALRRSRVPDDVLRAISRIHYDLSLAVLGTPKSDPPLFLARWLTS